MQRSDGSIGPIGKFYVCRPNYRCIHSPIESQGEKEGFGVLVFNNLRRGYPGHTSVVLIRLTTANS